MPQTVFLGRHPIGRFENPEKISGTGKIAIIGYLADQKSGILQKIRRFLEPEFVAQLLEGLAGNLLDQMIHPAGAQMKIFRQRFHGKIIIPMQTLKQKTKKLFPGQILPFQIFRAMTQTDVADPGRQLPESFHHPFVFPGG